MIERYQTNSAIPIDVFIKDSSDNAITGLTDIVYSVRRYSDDYYLDFSDNTFKNTGWTTKEQVLTEVDATEAPGEYKHVLTTSTFVNAVADDTYVIRVRQTTLSSAKNVPQFAEFILGQYVDNIDGAITAVPAAVDTELTSTHGSGSWQSGGTPEDIATAVWGALYASNETISTMGWIMKLIRALVTSEMEQNPSTNEYVIKDPDSGLPWIEFDTQGADGNPASVNVYKRVPK